MDFQLDKHTIFLAVAGSWAYGTNLPTSDVDLKGFGLPPRASVDLARFRVERPAGGAS